MLLQLKPLFMGEIESLPIDAELDFSGVEFQGIHPFTQPVRVKGEAACSAGVVTLRAAANGSFPGYNCRITAFGLFSEFITAGADQPEVQGEDSLFTDLETVDADPNALCGDSTAKFCALFAPVNAADSTEVEAQVKVLQEDWAARGIAFADSKASMISVVFHDKFSDEDNTLFIGHVGVLLPAEDGTMYFIEKVAFQEPYRLVKLQNRTELSDYLMEKYDTSWGQDTTHPFIMENDTLMDGYRPNPLEETNP